MSSAILIGFVVPGADAANEAMAGARPTRNNVVAAGSLPSSCDVAKSTGLKWKADLGKTTYGGPVVAGGKVFVGTNNDRPRDPEVTGDRGVLMAFSASDGTFLWQAVHDKLPTGEVEDWPQQGVCSSPHVRGDRLYYVSNRGELVCADTEGHYDGENDGPVTNEARRGETDADIVWTLDLRGLGVRPKNMTASAPLLVGDRLYVATSNGVGPKGKVVAPNAPSLIAVDATTGKVLWQDNSPGADIVDGQWSSPTLGLIGDRAQLLFAAGDGRLYAFDPGTGKKLWSFDLNQALEDGDGRAAENLIASPVIAGDTVYLGVGQDPERGPAPGRLWALRVTAGGDGPTVTKKWLVGGDDFSRTVSNVVVHDGLVYAADLAGFVHCFDAATGAALWQYDSFAGIWGSPLYSDGKVFVADEDGDVAVLAAGRTKKLLGESNVGRAVYTTPAAADGVLYIAAQDALYAIAPPSTP